MFLASNLSTMNLMIESNQKILNKALYQIKYNYVFQFKICTFELRKLIEIYKCIVLSRIKRKFKKT